MVVECSVSGVFTIVSWVIIKPRFIAVDSLPAIDMSRMSTVDNVKLYFRNYTAVIILFAFSMVVGSFIFMITVIPFLIKVL